jgi:predicted dehydrogenase
MVKDAIQQSWPMPANPRPIVIFGAGSIVRDAHLPAYRAAGFPIAGLYDPDIAKAKTIGQKFNVPVFVTLKDAACQPDAIFDLATPPAAHLEVLNALPEGSFAVMQKPMGSTLQEASAILKLCQSRHLKACVNFQLRFAPMMLALKDLCTKGLLGEIVDIDMWVALETPWGLWEFLADLPRVEILLHSIHYFDAIRHLVGNPVGIHAKTLGHPQSKISNTRTAAILDYGDRLRCALSINHNHPFGRKYQACEMRVCGTKGAAYLHLGVNLNYPEGEADKLEVNLGQGWENIALEGSWFTESFGYRMAQLQRYANGEESELISNANDAWRTMALIEAAYESSAQPATRIQTEMK